MHVLTARDGCGTEGCTGRGQTGQCWCHYKYLENGGVKSLKEKVVWAVLSLRSNLDDETEMFSGCARRREGPRDLQPLLLVPWLCDVTWQTGLCTCQ